MSEFERTQKAVRIAGIRKRNKNREKNVSPADALFGVSAVLAPLDLLFRPGQSRTPEFFKKKVSIQTHGVARRTTRPKGKQANLQDLANNSANLDKV